MKPSYPFTVPVLGTYSGSDYPKAEHVNVSNRELEAICIELGLNPKVIRDYLAPNATPASVAEFNGMIGNILKNKVGVDFWWRSAVPYRHIFGGHGNAATVGISSTVFGAIYGRGLDAAEKNIPVSYPGRVLKINAQVLTAQPGSGSLVFTLRKGGVDQALTLTFAAGAAADSIQSASGAISYVAGDSLCIKIVNNSAAAVSAQVGSFSIEYDQTG